MVGLEFYKMSGHGNDFVFVDNWENLVSETEMPELAKKVCRRQNGVGADGMVFIEEGPDEVDFSWRFFNSDGSEAEMCGNAGRCAAQFAYMTGIAPAEMTFKTLAGVIEAFVGPNTVKIKMTQPSEPEMDCVLDINGSKMKFCSINTGVPHAVAWVGDIEGVKVAEIGRVVRFHPSFKPAGTNVNFVEVLGEDRIKIRTYERGVEDETLACGTGAIASVLLSSLKGLVESPTRVMTRGGEELIVHFEKTGEDFTSVYLEGPVRVTFSGRLGPDIML